jgi:hypothetical protein
MADRYPYQAEAVGARDNRGGARAAESDPLAELARLIGQTDPNALPGRGSAAQPQRANYQDRHLQPQQPEYEQQSYEQQYEDQLAEPAEAEPATPSWMRAAKGNWQQQPSAHEPSTHEHATQHAHAAHQAVPEQQQHYQQDEYDDTPAFLRTARQHDPSRYDQVLYDQNSQNVEQPQYADGQYQDGQYQDGYQDQNDPNGYPPFYADAAEEAPRRKRGGLMTVVAVLALAVVGTAGAYGYRSYSGGVRGGEPPVIKAEPGANKIVPPTQTTDASGKIVDRIGGSAPAGAGPERVLSREEQPIDLNGRNAPRVVFPGGPSTNPPAQVAAAAPTPPSANGAFGDEPKRIRTQTIRSDQPDVVPQQGNQPPRAPTQARAQAPAPGNTPVSLAPGATPTTTRSVATAPAPSRSAGGYMVQISSQRSEADAQASYQAQQSKYPDVLGSRQASIRRADLGEKGIYYRAYVGPFAAEDEAKTLCSNLRSAGGQCLVQRN